MLVEVRKPGRPLSSCPHPSGSCSCERVVINYTIPKASECACPSDRPQPLVVSSTSGRVQKTRNRKSSSFNPSVLEKAIKASHDGETDASSLLTRTPTSESNDASPLSSASSTPRVLPQRKESSNSDFPDAKPVTSSCCQPKPAPPQAGSCCSGKAKEPTKPIQPKKSCCSGGSSSQSPQPPMAQPNAQPPPSQSYSNFPQYPPQMHHAQYGMMNQGNNYMQMPPPFNFNTPIYNHITSLYQSPNPMPAAPMNSHAESHTPEHNCHCGDSCSCFGCAAHPNNATMVEYVRSMHQFMSTGQFGALPPPTYDMPSYPHHTGYSAEASLAYNSAVPNFLSTNQLTFQANMTTPTAISQSPVNVSSPWSQSPVYAAVQAPSIGSHYFAPNGTSETTSTTPQDAQPFLKTEEPLQSPTLADSPSDGKDEDAATLSPSSYFWQEMVLPGCNDATGTCQCGDGCECVGCLTHGGHNGVPLEMPATTVQDAFTGFVSPIDMISSGSNHFMSFSDAPA